MAPMPKISNARVLATGAAGFIGSHLAENLAAAGAKVRVLSLYKSFNDWGWLQQVSCLKHRRPRTSLAEGVAAIVAAERATRG